MTSKWILRGVAIASVLVSYNCRSRRNNNDNTPTPAPTTAPVAAPVAQPGMQPTTPPAAQPTMPQPGMQPGVPPPVVQPGMQPGMQPVDPTAQPGMQPVGGDFIAGQMTARQAQFATGMAPVLPLTRGTLATGGSQNYAVNMVPGQCYKIIGVGGPGVSDLDLKLFDPTNTMVDQDIATDNFPVIGLQRQLCPTAAGQYRLEVLMFSGAGEFGVQVFGR